MTVLAHLAHGLVSVQCDMCIPPVLTVNSPDALRRTGWSLRSDGAALDACPNCSVRVAAKNRVARADAQPVIADPSRLPNIVVVGATKAGTTSMHNYLEVHPEIAVSAEKELRFFTDPDCRNWLGAYQDQFVPGTRYRAESTPFYSKSPCFPGVVDRMADLVPDAKLIYLVRDPVDRIVAEYVEQLQWRATSRSLDVELADPDEATNALVASSRYATQAQEYLKRFPREQLLILDLADLATDVVGTMGRVFDFLDLDHPDVTVDDFGRHNTRDDKRAMPVWLLALRRGPIVRGVRRLPEGPRQALSRLVWNRMRTKIAVPQASEETLAELRDSLRPEIERLRELTGENYGTWSV